MRTKQLTRALKTHPETRDVFLGVFPSDKLPRVVPPSRGAVALIANTDPSHKAGQHWCAFYITPECAYFFDSYGNPPSMVKSFDRLMRCRRRQKVFGRRIQGEGRVCGHYCLYYILQMTRLHDRLMADDAAALFARFGDDLNANDRVVRNYAMANFRIVT